MVAPGRTPAPEPQADWRWVEEWRRGGEPTPWGPGLFLAGFAGLIIGCAVYVISPDSPDTLVWRSIANVVVAVGLTPALWMSRGLPVLRWVALGGAVGHRDRLDLAAVLPARPLSGAPRNRPSVAASCACRGG